MHPPLPLALLLLLRSAASQPSLRTPSLTSHSLSTAPLLLFVPAPDTPTETFVSLSLCGAPPGQPPLAPTLPTILIVSNSTDNRTPSPAALPARPRPTILGHQPATGDYADLRAGLAALSLLNSVGLWIALQPPLPPLPSTLQLGLSTTAPLHSSHAFPALRLDDTDDANALLIAADPSVLVPAGTRDPPPLSALLPIILPSPDSLQLGLASSLCYLQALLAAQPPEARAAQARIAIVPSLTDRTTGLGSFSSQPTGNASDHDYRISDSAAGLRTQYLITNLAPATNYSAWLFQPGPVVDNVPTGRLWPYISFRTKSTKNCRLLHDLPFCPSVAYAVPASPSLSTSAVVAQYNRSVSGHLANFRTVVSTYPCNNDTSGRYSFVTGCGDCLRAYTDWACAVALPRCVDPPAPDPTGTTQLVFARPDPASSRTPNISDPGGMYPYVELPPCASLCTLVAATCPPLLGWACPLPSVSRNASMGAAPRSMAPLPALLVAALLAALLSAL
ncbi:hypothetical protein PtA15_11A450 [Puccinia triticina]|uniref:Stretch-activated cation channel mid1 n=1 Tax=Puccinia triticina TaxID=208348 RepID=A0ABY7CWT0_9BASI|nr:uncharacterized protein PtA15_11A450 [Puccinia triticina]WAQ89759.1 hypothetical protein PtA15_11A450 [Puccinia triticina]WAR59806.1 hypothetical protein PtB15_11B447 [Puccinia triticina]